MSLTTEWRKWSYFSHLSVDDSANQLPTLQAKPVGINNFSKKSDPLNLGFNTFKVKKIKGEGKEKKKPNRQVSLK